MKFVKITYQCDYCKLPISTDDDTVCVLHPGRIGYHDSLIPDPEDSIRHYHDYCMEYLLCLTAGTDPNKKEAIEETSMAETEMEGPTSTGSNSENKKPGGSTRKDLGKVKALFDAGWSIKEIAIEFGVTEKSIYNWKKEIEGGGSR